MHPYSSVHTRQLRETIFLLAIVLTSVLPAAEIRHLAVPKDGIAPDAEVDAQGIIHMAWVAGENVFYARSTDDGRTLGPSLRVNSEPDSAHAGMFRGPDLAVGAQGAIHVIWFGNGYQRNRPKDQWGVMYARMEGQGTAFSPVRNLNGKPSDNYSLAADDRGNVAVFWMAGGLFLTASADGGRQFAAAEKIEGADTCECCASRTLYTRDGSLYTAFRDKTGNIRDMFVGVREPKTAAFRLERISGTPWEINGCPMTGTFLAPTRTGIIMGLETRGEISYRRVNRSGAAKATSAEIPVKAGHGGKYPVVLTGPDGSVVVSWKRGTALEWQRFDSQDRPDGDMGSAPGRSPHRHAGVVTKSGDFLLID